MAVSPWSAALRAGPGVVPRPVVTGVPMPPITMPSIPAVPAIDDARAPNATNRAWLQARLGALPGRYNPLLGQVRLGAQHALAGYGGFRWHEDDPGTAEREDLRAPDYDPNAPLGERQKQAVRAERNAANARGMLSSSFTGQAIGSALTRLNEEARGIVQQYASQINQILGQQSTETTDIVTDWTRLYGEDARFLVENPPPALPPPPPAPGPAPPAPPLTLETAQRAADESPILWSGKGYPDLALLHSRWPGVKLGVRRTGSGGYVVVAGPGDALPPGRDVPPPLPRLPNRPAALLPPVTRPRRR